MIGDFRNTFIKRAALMLSGNGLALVIPFILGPVITRLYSPEEIGSYELFARIVAVAAIIATLRFELALVLPREDKEALGLMKLSLKTLFFVSLSSILILLLFFDEIVLLLENKGLETILWWLPITLIFSGLFQILQNYSIRIERFRLLSVNRILASGANHGSKAAYGFFNFSYLGLALGHLTGLVLPVLHFLSSKKIRSDIKRSFAQSDKGLWKEYRDFPIVNSSHVLSDEVKNFAIFAIISITFGEVTLGLFALTMRYLRVPVDLLGSSIGSVFLQAASKSRADGESFYPLLKNILAFLFFLGIIPFGTLFFFGQEIFAWFFGNDWILAGKYASLTAPWLFISFVVSPISSIPVIVNRQKTFFGISLAMNLSVVFLTIYLSKIGFSIDDVVFGISFGHSLFLIVLLLWFINISRKLPLSSNS